MEKFYIHIPCKPYVRRFIELNFGDPADFSSDKALYELLRSKLQKKSFRYDRRLYASFDKYTAKISIKIRKDDFYRHGWELSRTDIAAFNKIMEGRAKSLLYTTVGALVLFGYQLNAGIDYFQQQYGFTEDIWPKESIYRDCQRNLHIEKEETKKFLTKTLNGINVNNNTVK